jgi:hypothetical protein
VPAAGERGTAAAPRNAVATARAGSSAHTDRSSGAPADGSRGEVADVTPGDDPHPPSRGLQLALAVPTRQRPDVRRGLPIGAYSDDQLDELVGWLQSDEQERTREQLAAALRDELGITRRSYRIDTAVRSAITRAMR